MFGFTKKSPEGKANSLSDQQLRAQALDQAIRASGPGAPLSRIADAANGFYRFLSGDKL